ncbi:class I poly(R)-hydroxyalkanoic acid synthase [Cupriavidus sp. CV2]|uniref:PHA/PHB synthase family protein n=1 Tax=Cupriavidus ulmosensis TaxID=3065913 RepID=UPI00296AEC16|nr:class I poly(R)-hydroxyalkanoic acid synthase [Cupriavidus sp. CV2]MDW3686939.1 class I poly(R)-hydroxyalkanoic acid synthase [Cupriavidus sp. CV2]
MASPHKVPDEYIQGFIKSGQSLWQAMMLNPAAQVPGSGAPSAQSGAGPFADLQLNYFQQQFALWTRMIANMAGQLPDAVVAPERGDRRFSAVEWRDNPAYSLLKQSYLLNARLAGDMVEAAALDEPTKQRLRFYTRQFIDSMSPANFAATNPEVMQLAFETRGESLQAGLKNLLADMRKGGLSITDETAFEIGKNVAVSEGAVVFENALFQLIQYAPLTERVATRPLLIVPPSINKFYILDLQPENSFVRFAVEQGHTLFLVSWRNPDATCGHITWDDYLSQGVMKAIEVALAISGADKLNALGWCVGGTILSCALAVLRARADTSVASLTLLTTMLDFQDPGDLGVFIDEQGVASREQAIGQGGIYPGAELGFVFQTLRANDLIWPNVINHYLKGKSPEAFDLLYWNADSTNLPGPMYAWYLRNMYLENNLCVADRLTMCGTPVDLGRIDLPSYVLATQDDHIVPWKSAYRTTQLVGGKTQFVLGASGHIAGVINPASKNKRRYWTGGTLGDDADQWLASAEATPGSWWPHWIKWLAPKAGKPVDARSQLGSKKYAVIEAAPGRYVKVRAE